MRTTTIQFSNRMTEIANDLINDTDARTLSEVVRNAMALYHLARKEQKEGNGIAIVKDGEIVKEIVLGL